MGDNHFRSKQDTEFIRNALFESGIIVKQVSSSLEVLDSNNLTMVLSAVSESNADVAAIVTRLGEGVNTTLYLSEDGTMIGRVSRSYIMSTKKIPTCYTRVLSKHVRH